MGDDVRRRVLITGGAGYLGRGILRAVARGDLNWDVTVFSRDEAKHVKVRSKWPNTKIVRGDVTAPVEQLARVFTGHDLIIHAGANKLIDLGEVNAIEVVRNNVCGSMNVMEAAMRAGVEQVIGISTDKATQPVNVYGATKMILERLFQEADTLSPTSFKCVRYGNVIGSTISIVTYFREQRAAGEPLRLTDPNMTRFYMGVDDGIKAICTTIEARGGSVVIPKMAAVKLPDMARIALGLQPEDELPDDKVAIVGARPGEKIHESLLHKQESVRVMPTFGIEGRADDSECDYFQLRPPGENHRIETFEITSDNPPLGWMPFERVEELIADAGGL